MNSRKETLSLIDYQVTVVIPKLNGFFRSEFGHRRNIVRASLGDITLVPIGSSAIRLSAPDKKTVEEFLEAFRGEDRTFNPTRDAYRKPAKLTDHPKTRRFR